MRIWCGGGTQTHADSFVPFAPSDFAFHRCSKEKLPEIKEGDSVWSTFEQSLETWIGLEYLPRLNAALKKRNKSGGAS